MPHRTEIDDGGDDEDDVEPAADGEEFESTEDDEETTIPCPYCRRQIYEDSQRCPYCENYISEEDAPPRPRSPWFAVGFLACAVIVLMWILWGL